MNKPECICGDPAVTTRSFQVVDASTGELVTGEIDLCRWHADIYDIQRSMTHSVLPTRETVADQIKVSE